MDSQKLGPDVVITSMRTGFPTFKLQGFTLIELMVAVAIGAILLALAAPNFSDLFERVSVGSKVDDLVQDIKFTRTAAIGKGSQTRICASDDQATCCTTACDDVWSSGWIAFNDCDGNSQPTTGSSVCFGSTQAEEILKVRSYQNNSAGSIVADGDGITFLKSGAVNTILTTQVPITISVCDDAEFTDVVVNMVGHVNFDDELTSCTNTP